MKTAFITGTSSGLGRGLAEVLSRQGWAVHGCSRRGCDLPLVRDRICDLTHEAAVPKVLIQLLADVDKLDLVVLNAGIVGEIKHLTDTPLDDLKRVIEGNLWAHKTVMDWLRGCGRPVDQIVMVWSGTAVLGNKGWGGYALSKVALTMLAKLYAQEFPQSHLTALAPGIIDNAMMDHLCDEADANAFPALQRLRDTVGTNAMPGPVTATERLASILPHLWGWPSGSFVDIRKILDPEAHAKLYRTSQGQSTPFGP